MTTTVNNEHKNIKVPNLRFPEFQGEWIGKTIGDIAPLQRGFDLPTGQICNGKIPVVYSNGIMNHHSSYKCVAPGLVTGRSGTIGKFTYIEDGYYWPHNTSLWVTDFHDNNPKFIYYLYQTIHIGQYSTGSGVPTLNRNNVHRHKTFIPKLKEQNKIAAFLSLLDERIVTQNKIIDKLQSLIKGIMVELQKQGEDRGTWKKLSLGDVLSERNERNTNLYQVFSVSVSQGIVNQVDYLGRSFAAKDTSKYNVVHYGDLVYTKSPTGSFPYGIVKQSINIDNVAVSPLYGVYEPRSFAIGAYLHEYFMSEINTHNYLHPLIQKGAKNTINITNQRFLENRVPMPVNSNELLLISKLLYSLNDKIKHAQNTLEEYHKQKQYLLRQMFI